MIQLVLVVLGVVSSTVLVLTGHQEAAGAIGGACAFVFVLSMM